MTIEENREPNVFNFSRAGLLTFSCRVSRAGLSVAEKLIRFWKGSTSSGRLFILQSKPTLSTRSDPQERTWSRPSRSIPETSERNCSEWRRSSDRWFEDNLRRTTFTLHREKCSLTIALLEIFEKHHRGVEHLHVTPAELMVIPSGLFAFGVVNSQCPRVARGNRGIRT